jgi:ADP-ribosylglycohydrolase
MWSPFVIPLAVFAMVILIVAIVRLAKIRDKEIEVQQRLHLEQLEHQRKMQELELELTRLRKGQ